MLNWVAMGAGLPGFAVAQAQRQADAGVARELSALAPVVAGAALPAHGFVLAHGSPAQVQIDVGVAGAGFVALLKATVLERDLCETVRAASSGHGCVLTHGSLTRVTIDAGVARVVFLALKGVVLPRELRKARSALPRVSAHGLVLAHGSLAQPGAGRASLEAVFFALHEGQRAPA